MAKSSSSPHRMVMRKSAIQTELERAKRNWIGERNSAALYRSLTAMEPSPRLRHIFASLAASEDEHSTFWEERLRSQGHPVPQFRPSLSTRIHLELARRFGVAFVIPSITIGELKDRDRYAAQEDTKAAELSEQERGHAAVMRAVGSHALLDEELATPGLTPSLSLGNKLRAAVLGANDGLVANFCLLMGLAGGGAQAPMILLAGTAGLLAGACSMALGEWLSVTNSREMGSSQIDKEVAHLWAPTGKGRNDLILLCEAKGMSEEEARSATERIMAGDPDALAALTREELSTQAAHLGGSPIAAAAVSFVLFALGAIVSLLPFLLLSRTGAIAASIGLSLAALFGFGVITSFFTGRSALFSGLRQVAVGTLAALITFFAGRLLGAVID
jgi:VIT1/CCC1 family predicted Fe2+/Mn2+ transporter